MTRTLVLVSCAATLSLLAGCGSGRIEDPATRARVQAIERATVKYRDHFEALKAGYRPLPACIDHLGLEYLQLRRARDSTIDLGRPEQLFYAQRENGGPLTLVGVGYFVPDTGEPPPRSPLGHLDGPIPGQYGDEATHFELHAWLYRKSPDGLLSFFNSDVGCP